MNNFVKFIAVSAAVVGAQIASASAMAAPVFPMQGLVDVQKGIQLQCLLGLSLTGANKINVSLGQGDSLCDQLVINSNDHDWNYDAVSGDVTIYNLDITTITLGDCAGDITAVWDDTLGELVIDTFLPAKTGGPNCLVWGAIPN